MTTNINITQTWWRLLSAVGSTLITLVAWLGYMALCMVGEVILGNCEVHLRHHHFHSFYGGTDWNIHLVIDTLSIQEYENKKTFKDCITAMQIL